MAENSQSFGGEQTKERGLLHCGTLSHLMQAPILNQEVEILLNR